MRRLTLFIAAVLLVASAGAAFGTDKINGKPLADVHDIIREVNGEEAIVPKVSILELTQIRGNSSLHGTLWTADIDQSRRSYTRKKKDVMQKSGFNDTNHYMGLMAAATTRRIFGEGAERRVVVGDLKYGGSGYIKTFLTAPTNDGSIKIFGEVRSLPVKFPGAGNKLAFTDMRAGLFIDGERTESFVAGFMDDKDRKDTFSGGDNGGKIAGVGFLILDGRKLNDESFTGDPTAYVKADAESTDAQFPVMRIVAGDFDGDGIRSEIAYIATPKEKSYYLHIYKVSRDPDDSSKVKLEDLWSETFGDIDLGMFHGSQRDTEAGCDIVAGDFDGDGITELAAAVISGTGSKLKPLVKTYKFVDGKFKSSDEVFEESSSEIYNTVIPGLLAAAGDFDGNGADDVAISTSYKSSNLKDWFGMQTKIFAFDAVAGGAPRPFLKTYASNQRLGHQKYTPLARVASVAAGPMFAAAGNGGMCDELYLSVNETDGNGDDNHKNGIYHMDNKYMFELWDTSNEGGKVTALIAADLAGESMALGECDHIIVEDVRSYFMLLPAVPYHIDYIRSDWRDPKTTPAPRSLQFVTPMTSEVTYSTTDDGSFTKASNIGFGYGLEGCIEGGFIAGTPKDSESRYFLKKLGIKVDANIGVKAAYEGLHKWLASATSSWSTTLNTTARKDDIAHYYTGTLHTWRYPIKGTLADDAWLLDQMFADEDHGGDVMKDDPLKNAPLDRKQPKYYSVTRLSDVRDGHNGELTGDRYQPLHDERNLFSYPNDLKFINDYATKAVDLSLASSTTTDYETSTGITFDQIESGTNSWYQSLGGAIYANVTGSVAVPPGKKSVFSPHLGLSGEANVKVGGGLTYTSTTKSSESYTVHVKGDEDGPRSHFEIIHAAYVNSGGMTTLGFAINLRHGPYPARAWDDKGPYASSPDPSLVLPSRVFAGSEQRDSGISVSVATAETRPYVATVMRGVRIYDRTAREDPSVGTSYTVSTLVRGRKYTFVIPVYNASFVDTDNFEVRFGYTTQAHVDELTNGVPAPDDPAVTLITSTDMSLRGWVLHSDAHRGTVAFDWEVPLDMPKDHYAMCVRIVGRDGDIHRDWNVDEESGEYDPCGNDWGHFRFSVIDEQDIFEEEQKNTTYVSPVDGSIIKSAAASGEGELRAAASPGEPNVKLAFKVEGQSPMKFDEFRRWLLGRTDPVDVEIEVAYTGDTVVRGVYVVVYEQLEGGSIRTLVDRDFSALFPGRSISRHVRIDPQKFLSRDLCVKISGSSISHTFGEPTEDGSSSGSGCAAGAAGIAAIALLFAATRRKK